MTPPNIPRPDFSNPVHLAVAGVVIVGALFYLSKKLVSAATDVAVGAVTGDNAITQNQTDAAGNKTNAYVGGGIPGTLGAVANTASGGFLASFGETIGEWTFNHFGPKVDINPHLPPRNIDGLN